MDYKKISDAYKAFKEAEKAYKELAQEAVEDMKERNVQKEETDYGKFTITTRKSYEYSDKIDTMNEKLKLAKLKEEQKGIAKEKVSESLRFTPIKE